ncbi:L-rhamnose mutarotase [soil metagenome]
MNRLAFKMKLMAGNEQEYRRRHDDIWPDLVVALKQAGISDYNIFLDEETNFLFGSLSIENAESMSELPRLPVMKKWWVYMKDIMETNEDNSPVSIPLKEVFHLP